MNYDIHTDEIHQPKSKPVIPQVYDLGLDERRDVTQADIHTFEMMTQLYGCLNPMNRALAAMPAKVARGELSLDRVREATKVWTDMLGLDPSGR